MWALLVIVLAPILLFFLSVCKAQEPVSVQTFRSEAPVEFLDKRVIGRLAWAREVERDAALISPQVQITLHELSTLIDPYGCRKSHLPADPFQHLDDVGAAECKPRFQRRREPRERVDNREHTKFLSRRHLIVHEVHRPSLVRSRRRPAVVPQLGLDPALGRFVPQLQT